MGIKFLIVGLLLTTAQLLLSSGCNKNRTDPCPGGEAYLFSITSSWNPQGETYSVGDTLLLNCQFSKQLIDQINSSILVNYENSFGISGNIGMVLLDTVLHQFIPAKDSFSFVNIVGSFSEASMNKERTKSINLSELSNQYQFTGGIVCNKKGIYEIDVDNLYSRGINGKNCTNAKFDMTVTNANKNINLYQYALGITPTTQRQKVMYCFRVQ